MERFKTAQEIQAKKSSLRAAMRRRRAGLDAEQKRVWDLRITEIFSQSGLFSDFGTFYCYFSTDEEVDTRELIEELLRAGKRVACPRVEARGKMSFFYIRSLSECCPGFRGIPEPVKGAEMAQDESALVIVPGLAFSKEGRRLGYGGGYYDRFLSSEPEHETLGLSYDFQIRDDIPKGEHDILINMLLTPERLIICGGDP